MAFVNLLNRSIQAKIVYYGPGWSGKTTNLEYIHSVLRKQARSDMVSINTHGDRTLFFDFLPLEFDKVKGFDLRLQLYTVPGQTRYDTTRRLVLKGVDGVVFVADSRVERMERNRKSLENLEKHLQSYNLDIRSFPLVMQFNKRDLAEQGEDIVDIDEMERSLNGALQAPSAPASALHGENVLHTLKVIIRDTIRSLQENTGI